MITTDTELKTLLLLLGFKEKKELLYDWTMTRGEDRVTYDPKDTIVKQYYISSNKFSGWSSLGKLLIRLEINNNEGLT